MPAQNSHDIDAKTGDLGLLDRYWRAANYLSVGQVYLLDNALRYSPEGSDVEVYVAIVEAQDAVVVRAAAGERDGAGTPEEEGAARERGHG